MIPRIILALLPVVSALALGSSLQAKLRLNKADHITLVGAGMGSRMVHYGHFETELHLASPRST